MLEETTIETKASDKVEIKFTLPVDDRYRRAVKFSLCARTAPATNEEILKHVLLCVEEHEDYIDLLANYDHHVEYAAKNK